MSPSSKPEAGPVTRVRELVRHPDARRFVRFLLVGGLNTAFSYGSFALLVYMGVHYSLAGLVATIAGIVWNFHTTGSLVFDSTDRRKMLRYFGVYALLYFWSLGVLRVGELLGYSPYVVAAAMLLPNAGLGYVLNKHLVFRSTT